MKPFVKLTTTELKLYFREPVGLFFTLAFPLLLPVSYTHLTLPKPPNMGVGSLPNAEPKMSSKSSGKASVKNSPTGSRKYSFSSVVVSLTNGFMDLLLAVWVVTSFPPSWE